MTNYFNQSTPLPSQTPGPDDCFIDERLTIILMGLLSLSLLAFIIMSLLYLRLYFKQSSPRRRSAARRPNTLNLNRTKGDTAVYKQCDLQRAHSLPAIELMHTNIPPVPTIQSVGSSNYEDIIPNSGIPASTVKGVPKHSYEAIIPNSGIPASTVKGVPKHSYEAIIPKSGIPASTVKGVPKHRWSAEDGYVNEFDMPPCPYTAGTAVNKILPLNLPKPLAMSGWSIND